jgi:HEAT repeat protein
MKRIPSARNREGARLKVLWPLALLMVLVIAAVLVVKSPSAHRAKPAGDAAIANVHSNATAGSRESFTHLPRAASLSPSPPPPGAEPETERLTAVLFNNSAPVQARRKAALALAGVGTDQAVAALKSGLTNNLPPYVKASIAESLGQISNPEATELLHELANGKDETIARGAARGLAARGDNDAANTLGTLLFNDQTPLSVRTEAALALGDVDLPAAQDLLTRAISQIHDDDVLESALDGMGRRPFSETQDFFRNYLNSPTVPADAKVLAIEAVRDADGDVALFLSNYVNNADPEVSNAAKDALDFIQPTAPNTSPAK